MSKKIKKIESVLEAVDKIVEFSSIEELSKLYKGECDEKE